MDERESVDKAEAESCSVAAKAPEKDSEPERDTALEDEIKRFGIVKSYRARNGGVTVGSVFLQLFMVVFLLAALIVAGFAVYKVVSNLKSAALVGGYKELRIMGDKYVAVCGVLLMLTLVCAMIHRWLTDNRHIVKWLNAQKVNIRELAVAVSRECYTQKYYSTTITVLHLADNKAECDAVLKTENKNAITVEILRVIVAALIIGVFAAWLHYYLGNAYAKLTNAPTSKTEVTILLALVVVLFIMLIVTLVMQSRQSKSKNYVKQRALGWGQELNNASVKKEVSK